MPDKTSVVTNTLHCPSCGYVHHGGTESDVAIWRDEGCFNGCATEPEAPPHGAPCRGRGRMARFGPGPGTTPEQTLNTIAVWAENKLHKLGAWPPGPADRAPKPQPDGGRTHG